MQTRPITSVSGLSLDLTIEEAQALYALAGTLSIGGPLDELYDALYGAFGELGIDRDYNLQVNGEISRGGLSDGLVSGRVNYIKVERKESD